MDDILFHFPQLSQYQQKRFEQLGSLYAEWNSKINVISRKDFDEFYTRHVLHSLAIAKVVDFESKTKVLDVGTGGGFPAVPLAVLFPEVSFLAVDSIGKKIKVVNAIAKGLQLTNLTAKHSRAEEIDEKFDFVVSRAVTRTKNFLPWVQNKIKEKSFNERKNGFLFLKGGDLSEELSEVKRKYETFHIQQFFSNDFFETKKVIYMPK